ncbi:hypothetical protein BCV70DRAFT_199282 [Testicularia cyperi]|uniref:Endopolyphosphatase n=1 Tax=Testicularia cyperi TaxID=1882483 RepID=A0A317XRC9_9BASI|nr:hypothetical protein BCV70DRAFT_199282 [Testicularia cyperi]
MSSLRGTAAVLATLAMLVASSESAAASAQPPHQAVFRPTQGAEHAEGTRLLRPAVGNATVSSKPFGRFLHITDLHPDHHYKVGSAVRGGCHHKKPKKKKPEGKERAGWWGTGVSDCDSPPRLIESSLRWVANNWLPQPSKERGDSDVESQQHSLSSADGLGIDFIIWTGDSARHDNDNKLPRTNSEIFELNRWTLQQIESAFPGVPLVPSIGNNDIFPHNILFPGPNSVTKEYVQIWQDHIPEYEFHTFEQGGYYVKELLPNRLAAMSLNTLYFYDNNKAVDGCTRTKKGHSSNADPGTAQLDWLEVQLDLIRKRGMQVHLLGHVPPTAGNYFERCYRRYTDIVLRYQDTIVGQHFGHMNTDAFFIQEDDEAVYGDLAGNATESEIQDPPPVSIEQEEGLPADLKQDFSTLPGKGRTNEDFYSVFYIAPSIIPTYYPSVRVWTYNTSESGRYISDSSAAVSQTTTEHDALADQDDDEDDLEEEDEDEDDAAPVIPMSRHHHRPTPRKGRKHKRKKKRKQLPRHASADSPSRKNTYLSLLGYSQWVMDIDDQNDEINAILNGKDKASLKDGKKHKDGKNKDEKKDKEEQKRRRKEAEKQNVSYRLEYTTYEPSVLWQQFVQPSEQQTADGPLPVPKSLLDVELKRAGVKQPFISLDQPDADEPEDESNVTPDSTIDTLGKKKKRKNKQKLEKALRKFTDYSLPSATVGEMMDLGRKLMVDKKLWKRFKRRIYSESGV